ncbi:MAG: hypothetical protein ACFE94_18665 [Candidatus Hodarchaeota archaeon]
MRHFYKTHGKHCYLRSFQSKCSRCGADVLYWECRHGSKVFFNYPPYGKLVRHFCRYNSGRLKVKTKYPVIVKKPKGLLVKESPTCPACGRLFNTLKNLNDHINNLKKQDNLHQNFVKNKLNFELGYQEESQVYSDKYKSYYKPKFGKINIKKKK